MTNHRSLRILPVLVAGWLLAGSAGSEEATVGSLRPTDVATADEAPAEKAMLGRRPGSQQPIPRTFEQQPPLIPHAMTNFDEITPADNQCLECHGPDTYQQKKATRLSDSHFRDQRSGALQPDMSGARYQCTLCHVPQSDATPLVENLFVGTAPPATKPRPRKR